MARVPFCGPTPASKLFVVALVIVTCPNIIIIIIILIQLLLLNFFCLAALCVGLTFDLIRSRFASH